jgi:serine/threonine-protein kinase ULK2
LFSEINILRELHHPHIVGLFDCRETSTNIHLVMEYCPMGDLAYFMRKREQYSRHEDFVRIFQKYPNPKAGGLHEVFVRHFFQQLASALRFLRDKDLIHRDVKPQNLLIVPPRTYYDTPRHDAPYFPSNWTIPSPVGVESLPVLKLADFGFARSLPKTALAETLCGSPLYMAPEILRYEKYDAKADLWSVGTVTFEMLTGKPPFRAANHIELLRKIENTDDKIKFPDEPRISPDMQRIVKALLKREPKERISFTDFFDDSTVKDEIPGLVEDDRRRLKPSRTPSTQSSEQSGRPPQPLRTRSSGRDTNDSDSQEKFHDAVDYPSQSQRPVARETATAPGQIPQIEKQNSRRASPADPSAPVAGRKVEAQPMRRTASREQPTPPTIPEARESDSVAERAAQDIAFERDYVLVEKRAVEVNAFADEMAASPRVNRTTGRRESNPQPNTMTRRNTTQNTPPQVAGFSTTPSRNAAPVSGSAKRPEHLRQESLEKRVRQGTSTTSAISKAVAMASGRLFSFGISPPVSLPVSARGTPSPPVYGPFPSYPTTGTALTGAERRGSQPLDEDTKVLQAIEESAHRSDVVYGFAEVKYKQLIPLAPSVSGDGLGLKEAGIPGKDAAATDDEDGLTTDAIVQLSEEAFVLYIKSLSLLAHSMDVAGTWWAKKNRASGSTGSGTESTTSKTITPMSSPAAARMNRVVQWVRDRFNEVLEKAEFVRLKLIAAQKRLPPDHPNHPDNHPASSSVVSASVQGTVPTDDVHITPGVSAEKLMYVRALEMGKSAAVNELVCDDLLGCEIGYVTAIRMLEAVLDTDDEALPKRITADTDGASGKHEKGEVVEAGDREQIQKGESSRTTAPECTLTSAVVQGFHARLLALRQKLQAMSDRNAAVAQSSGPAGRTPAKSPVQGARSPAQRSPVLGIAQMAAGGSPRSR